MTIAFSDLRINSERLKQDFDELGEIGATVSGGITRLALSNEDLEARAWFANKVEESGFTVRDDEVGNLSGVFSCGIPDAKTLLTGSHLDTVRNGGKFDGSIGILAGLECLRTIRDAGIKLPVDLEVINFTDEEGWWQSFFGSMGFTGVLREIHINDSEQDNAAFRAALFRAGIRPAEVHKAKRNPDSLLGYIELHIEQSDILDSEKIDIGIVNGVVGRTTFNFTFYGEATHAATTSRQKRRDALQGAAAFITQMHQLIDEKYPKGVVNCGNVDVKPGVFNVVPAVATLRVELRHQDQDVLSQMESEVVQLAQSTATTYRLTLSPKRVLHRPVAPMSSKIQPIILQTCNELNLSSITLASYAGHDAQILSPFTPSAMIFIPCEDGISHNPREFTDWASVEKGANVLLHTLLKYALQ